MTGRIFDIHRLSTHDGPGMRTTVFLKGCSLQCAWCHNPESIHGYKELQWIRNKCIDCKRCEVVCPIQAIQCTDDGVYINRQRCSRCMACANICPTGALNVIGEDVTITDVIDILLQDKLFFENSGGGLTVSGGEPLLQGEFVKVLLKEAKEQGIHTAVDTSMQVSCDTIESVIRYVDLWLIDLKEMDSQQFEANLGCKELYVNERLKQLMHELKNRHLDSKVYIRTPLIPHKTTSSRNLKAIAAFINEINDGAIEKWELCTFNNLCEDKYLKLDKRWPMTGTELMTPLQRDVCYQVAVSASNGTYRVEVSGLTK